MSQNTIKDILGFSAAFCLIITLIPQLYYTWKTKKANDISYGFLCLQITTCILFLSYGILLNELPIIIANCLVLSQSFLLFFFKIKFSTQNKIVPINNSI